MNVLAGIPLADTAHTAGVVFGRLLGLAAGIALIVYGVRRLNPRPDNPAPNRMVAIICIVFGAVLVLGSLGASLGGRST